MQEIHPKSFWQLLRNISVRKQKDKNVKLKYLNVLNFDPSLCGTLNRRQGHEFMDHFVFPVVYALFQKFLEEQHLATIFYANWRSSHMHMVRFAKRTLTPHMFNSEEQMKEEFRRIMCAYNPKSWIFFGFNRFDEYLNSTTRNWIQSIEDKWKEYLLHHLTQVDAEELNINTYMLNYLAHVDSQTKLNLFEPCF